MFFINKIKCHPVNIICVVSTTFYWGYSLVVQWIKVKSLQSSISTDSNEHARNWYYLINKNTGTHMRLNTPQGQHNRSVITFNSYACLQLLLMRHLKVSHLNGATGDHIFPLNVYIVCKQFHYYSLWRPAIYSLTYFLP